MKTYTVYMLTPYLTWEDVKAPSKTEAIRQCDNDFPTEYDMNDGPYQLVAVEAE